MDQTEPLIGKRVKFKLRDSNNRVFTLEGIVNGRVSERGGLKYLVSEVIVAEPDMIGVRHVETI